MSYRGTSIPAVGRDNVTLRDLSLDHFSGYRGLENRIFGASDVERLDGNLGK
jgi:hypothetical protein